MTVCDAYSGGCTTPPPTAPPLPSPPPALPHTGLEVGDLVMFGFLAVCAGLVILMALHLWYMDRR